MRELKSSLSDKHERSITKSTHVSQFSSLAFHHQRLFNNAGNLITTTETHRGFAFVDFDSAEDAAAAIDNMHESELYGRTLRCNIAKPNRVKEGSGRAGKSDHNSVLFLRLRWFILRLCEPPLSRPSPLLPIDAD